ncbi:methyltransferase domain-containing protein [bacterium]|nr:methyltransferase domain-containing protein [candidate division CSSED10-310 bacterium]
MQGKTDNYTMETRKWLNQRFQLEDSNGYYIPNQPAYGFSAAAFRLEEYARMYAILHVLNRLPFNSLLDVGCADGYGPALIEHLFDVRVIGSDLSEAAIGKAEDLFSCHGVAADAHDLPFPDQAVDVCICSEVLEHVIDPAKVIGEMRRVARSFIVVSTPRAPSPEAREKHFNLLDPDEPHAHIQYFTDEDIRSLCGSRSIYRGARTRLVSRLFDRLAWCDETSYEQRHAYYRFMADSTGMNKQHLDTLYSMLIGRYRSSCAWKKRLVSRELVAFLIRFDNLLATQRVQTALDHLVVIPVESASLEYGRRRTTGEMLNALLGGFKVQPYRSYSG